MGYIVDKMYEYIQNKCNILSEFENRHRNKSTMSNEDYIKVTKGYITEIYSLCKMAESVTGHKFYFDVIDIAIYIDEISTDKECHFCHRFLY